MTTRAAIVAFASFALAGLGAGCQPKNNGTVVVVEVASDLAPGQLSRIDVNVRPEQGTSAAHSFTVSANERPPFRLAIVPEGDPQREFDVVARGLAGTNVVVSLTASLRFDVGAARTATLLLSRDCVDGGKPRACPGAEQCVAGGGCVGKKQVTALRPLGTPAPDAGAPKDTAAPADAPVDRNLPPRDASVVTGTWMAVAPPAFTGSLSGVAVVEKDVLVVGNSGPLGFAYRYDGMNWTALPLPPTTRALNAIWASGNDVWAVGAGGTVLRRVNGVFSVVPSGAPGNLNAVFGTGPNDVWLVGLRTVLHWDGTRLSTVEQGITTDVAAGAAVSPTDVWLVGAGGSIYRLRGAAWAREAEGLTAKLLFSAWASGPGDVWAAGEATALHFDGQTWSSVPIGDNTALALWGSADNDVWAVGRAGTRGGIIAHFNGLAWTEVTIPATTALLGVHGSGSGEVWAVGKEAVLRYR